MKIRLAHKGDLKQLVGLERLHLDDELHDGEQAKALDGQAFGEAEIKQLIDSHWICVAEREVGGLDVKNGEIVGYVMAGGWPFFESWPVYRHILKRLRDLSLDGVKLTKSNSCQYGPIWIKRDCRGQGIFEALVSEIKNQLQTKFPFMLTFIAEDNMASFSAHTNKASMQVLDFFTYDDRDYYLLASSTERSWSNRDKSN
ncbi:MAG: GNAT family N-acetyltransferase [Shewanella sp.]